MIAVSRIFVFRKREVEHSHGVHLFQAVVPVLPFGGLLAYGVGGIEERAVTEVLLLPLLHLHDEAAAVLSEAIDIKDCTAVTISVAEVFAVQVLHILYLFLLVAKERIKKTDEQVLVHLSTKQLLESKVGAGINITLFSRHRIMFHVVFFHILYISFAKVIKFFRIRIKNFSYFFLKWKKERKSG